MRARLAFLAAAVLGVCVFGLYAESKDECEEILGHATKDALKSVQDADQTQPFTCMSEVLSKTGEKKKTFVWVLHNDKPDMALYTKWEDAGMPIVRFPSSCRLVSNDTIVKEKTEKQSLVMYGPKLAKKHELQTFLMADPKPHKDDKEDGEGKLRLGSPLESQIVCTFSDKAEIKRVDVWFRTEVSEDRRTYTYTATSYGSQVLLFSVDDLMKKWNRENLEKMSGKVKKSWNSQNEADKFFRLPPAKSGIRKEDIKAEVFEVNLRLAEQPEETQANCLIYSPDNKEIPIGGGKVTVYLPKRKD
jgi:hypothetical protein